MRIIAALLVLPSAYAELTTLTDSTWESEVADGPWMVELYVPGKLWELALSSFSP